jgi:hypothetical protein
LETTAQTFNKKQKKEVSGKNLFNKHNKQDLSQVPDDPAASPRGHALEHRPQTHSSKEPHPSLTRRVGLVLWLKNNNVSPATHLASKIARQRTNEKISHISTPNAQQSLASENSWKKSPFPQQKTLMRNGPLKRDKEKPSIEIHLTGRWICSIRR